MTKTLTKLIKITLVIVIVVLFFRVCYRSFAADVAYKSAIAAIDNYDLPTALDSADTAIKLNPEEPNYYRIQARIFLNYLPSKTLHEQQVIKRLVINDLQTAYNLNPKNLVTIRNIIPLYYFVAAKDITSVASDKNIDPDFIKYTKDFYASVKDYSPNDAGVYALVARYEKRLGLVNEYNASVAKVRSLRPDLLDWYDSFR